MITGDIKQKVDAVWQTFWNKGFTNTSAIFEQITYLLFMKMLDDKQLEKGHSCISPWQYNHVIQRLWTL